MKKINKLLSILLATILILTLFPANLANATDDVITFSAQADVKGAKAGDVVNVNINMTETSEIAALTLSITYDNTALKILSANSHAKYSMEEFNTEFADNKLVYLGASAMTQAVSGTLFTIQFEVLKDGCTDIILSVDEIVDIDLNPLSSSAESTKIHYYDNGTVTTPTCTEQGYTTYACECGDTHNDNYVDANGHSFSGWSTETAPTCTESGLEKRTCSACNEAETNELSAIGHDYDYENGVLTRPTDSAKGYYTYTCKNDGNHTTTVEVESADYTEFDKAYNKIIGYLSDEDITAEAKGEILLAVQNATANNPNFFNNGNPRRDLIASEQEIVDDATQSANGIVAVVESKLSNCQSGNHDVKAYTPDNNATCTANGTKRGNCYVCGTEVVVTDENNPAFGHDIIVDDAVLPDCVNTGLTEGSHCSRCDDATVEQEIVPALGHSYNSVVTEPTCTESGYTTHTCSVCGDNYVDSQTNATGHNYAEEITKAATHTENGVMTYTCHCGDSYTETINATGDHYYVPTVTPPTCTEGGYTTYTCACNDSYVDDETPATGHSFGEWSTVTEPTCTAEGIEKRECADCDATETNELSATGHSYSSVVTASTCTETGYTTYTCANCDDSYVDDETPANGHSYNSVVTEPTCTENGYTTYTCANCDDSYVDDETPANGHSFTNGNCTVCGGEDPDYYVFSLKEPSIKTIRNKDGIILHTEIEGNVPEGSYVEWTSSNSNFDKTVMNKGNSLRVIANNKGYTTFTATLYDADGNELATDSVELYSKSGFFDKIGGFFRSIFGLAKIYEN